MHTSKIDKSVLKHRQQFSVHSSWMEARGSWDRNLCGVRDGVHYVDEKSFYVFPERFRLVRGICYVLFDVHVGPGLRNKPS